MKLATLCYVRDKSSTLMLLRNKKQNDIHEGKWNGLGGKLEAGESPEMCAVREVREESGLDIESPILHGFLTFPKFKDEEDWHVFLFSAEASGGTLVEDAPEGHLAWIPTDDLLTLNLWEGDRYFLEWMHANRFFSATFWYRDKRLRSYDVRFHGTIDRDLVD